MADIVLNRNVAQLGALKRLTAVTSSTAGGTGDAAEVTGVTIDRFGFSNGGIPGSLVGAVTYNTTLAAAKTLSIAWVVQDSADGTTFADYATGAAAVVATGPTGGGTLTGELEFGVDLGSAKRYVRMKYTPDLSATGTDTATTHGIGFFSGFDRYPQ